MSDLALSNKPKYGTGQFKADSSSVLKANIPDRLTTFDKYANNIKPIIGNDKKGIFKRFANSVSLESAYPTRLTESQRHGLAHKVRELIGGNNTVKNEADIEAYNTKPLFFNKPYTHGDVSTVSEVGTAVLGLTAGGLGLIKGIRKLPKTTIVNNNKTPISFPQYRDDLDTKWFTKETAEVAKE